MPFFRWLSKLRWKYNKRKFKKAFKAGLVELPYAPFKIWVEPTNRCNLKCVMCPQSKGLSSPMGFMEMSLYKKVLEELKAVGTHDINLFMMGEPLLHKGIVEMVSLAKEYGIGVKLHTNATLLTEKLSKELLETGGLEEISFSFDGEDAAYYEKLRVNADFEEVKQNIVSFLEIKRDIGDRRPRVTVQVIKPRRSDGVVEDISEDFKAHFKGLPVDRFKNICFLNFAGTLDGGDVVEYELVKNKYRLCAHLWKSFNISWDGIVLACCVDMNRKIVLGDIKTQSLMDIWNGKEAKRLRRAMVSRRFGDMEGCRDCDMFWR